MTFLLREFEVCTPSLYPRAFPALPSTPAPCYAQVLAGTVPFRKRAHLFSSFTKFVLFFSFLFTAGSCGSDDRTEQAEEARIPGYVL